MRPTVAEIHLSALEHNVHEIRRITSPHAELMGVVKADAYGHGAVPIAQALLNNGCSQLAIAIPEEGVQLRQAGITVPILILGLTLPQQFPLLLDYNLTPALASVEDAQLLSQTATSYRQDCDVFIPLDTGMSRIGFSPEQALPLIRSIYALPHLHIRGLFTHYASADCADKHYAMLQAHGYATVHKQLEECGIHIPYHSTANSAAIMEMPGSHYNLVRPGIILYGYYPSNEVQRNIVLRQVMELKTKVTFVKQVPAHTSISYGRTYTSTQMTKIATLPIGYADGYNRLLSNRGEVLIGGKRCPVAGRVCMDQIMVDVGPDANVQPGDEAVLFGHQGNEFISTEEIAAKLNTISYEVVCGISKRVPRVYVRD